MNQIVVDSSVSLAWAFADEKNDYTDKVLSMLNDSQMLIPQIGCLELVNAMYVGIKRERIEQNNAVLFLNLIDQLVQEKIIPINSSELFTFCQSYDLTSYDASFLILAISESCPLATQDKKLKKAAQNANITLV